MAARVISRLARHGEENWRARGGGQSYGQRVRARRSCQELSIPESILSDTFLGSPSAQPALVIALSERHAPRAQDVVCGDGVEIEVGQRKRKDEGLRREG